jgi:hypothetical protein
MKERRATQRVIVSQGSPVPTVNARAQGNRCSAAKMPSVSWVSVAKTAKVVLIFVNNNKRVKRLVIVRQDRLATTANANRSRSLCIVATRRMLVPQDKSVIVLTGNATNVLTKSNAKVLAIAPKAKIAKVVAVSLIRFLCIVADLRDAHPMPNVPIPMVPKAHAVHPLVKAMPIAENRHVSKQGIVVVKSNRPANGGFVPTASTKAPVFAIRATAHAASKVSAKWPAIVPKVKIATAENASLFRRVDDPFTAALSRDVRQDSVASNPTDQTASAQVQSAKFPKIAALQHANRSAAVIVCNSSRFAMIPVAAERHAV